MKIIESAGGPLICMSRCDVSRWGGIWSLNFFTGRFTGYSDYEVLCTDTGTGPTEIIGVASTIQGDILYFSLPLPTMIISSTINYVYIVQFQSREIGWSEKKVTESDFENVSEWKDSVNIKFKDHEMICFDSGCIESDFRSDILSACVRPGIYVCDWARQEWAGQADMIFIRVRMV